MDKTQALYRSLVGPEQGARKMHVHVTELNPSGAGWASQHAHQAEEAIYILEGEAEFTFDGKTHHVRAGEAVFFPSGILHAKAKFFTDKVKYLVIRTVEPMDDPCCCGVSFEQSS